MKKFLPIFFVTCLILISTSVFDQRELNSSSSGPNGGYSGAPGENNCTSCHSGTVNSGIGLGLITTNIPASGWEGGETYTFNFSITQTGISKFGFQASVETSNNNNTGTWTITNSTATKIVSSNYVTHKSTGTSGSGTRSWSVDWTAPCAGKGTITIYAAFNATNGNNSSSGDQVYTKSLAISENLINSADSVSNIVLNDIGDNLDGRDLRVKFKAPSCETKTNQYRILVVKQANASSFNVSAANAVSSANYKVVTTGSPGNVITTTLSSTSTDVNGDAIRNNQPYKIFVLGVANSTLVSINSLVESPSSITLTSPTATVTNILGSDIDDQGNGEDLEVNFKTPLNEGTVSVYRVIAVKASVSSSFTTSIAANLSSARFETFNTGTPNTTVSVPFNASSLDSDGDPIGVNIPYTIFILVKADGQNALYDTLQKSLVNITLGLRAQKVSNIVPSDISNNGNGTDLEVSFDTPVDESSISEYRVITVKTSEAPSFGEDDAILLTSGSYVKVSTGNPNTTQTIVFSSNSEDSDGDLITENQGYKLFVLSVKDGTNALLDQLTQSTDSIVLLNTIGLNELIDYKSRVYMNNGNIYIELLNDVNESFEYRLYNVQGKLITRGMSNKTLTHFSASRAAAPYCLLQLTISGKTETYKLFYQ